MTVNETSILWTCVWVLVVCNTLVIFHNVRKIYDRSVLRRRLQMELTYAPRLREGASSILVRYARLQSDKIHFLRLFSTAVTKRPICTVLGARKQSFVLFAYIIILCRF